MKTLAMLLPIAAMRKRADQFALYTFGRWDVPQGPDVPPDLRDTLGGFLDTTPDGTSHASLILPCDVMDISHMSPVSLILTALLPVCALLTAFPRVLGFWPWLQALSGGLGLLMAAAIILLLWRNQVGFFQSGKIFFIGFVIPTLSTLPFTAPNPLMILKSLI